MGNTVLIEWRKSHSKYTQMYCTQHSYVILDFLYLFLSLSLSLLNTTIVFKNMIFIGCCLFVLWPFILLCTFPFNFFAIFPYLFSILICSLYCFYSLTTFIQSLAFGESYPHFSFTGFFFIFLFFTQSTRRW